MLICDYCFLPPPQLTFMETEESTPGQKLLKKLFTQMSMTDLPAMSTNVQELISLTNSSQSTASDLTEVILKDFSLTNKILQIANSAYYCRGDAIGSVQRAITIIGFTVVRQLAMTIVLFEELIKNAEMEEHLIKLLTQSFLSGMVAKIHAENTDLHVNPDEAFLCTMLHNLGEIIVVVFLPSLYREFASKVKAGLSLNIAAKQTLNHLSFSEIGSQPAGFYSNENPNCR